MIFHYEFVSPHQTLSRFSNKGNMTTRQAYNLLVLKVHVALIKWFEEIAYFVRVIPKAEEKHCTVFIKVAPRAFLK